MGAIDAKVKKHIAVASNAPLLHCNKVSLDQDRKANRGRMRRKIKHFGLLEINFAENSFNLFPPS